MMKKLQQEMALSLFVKAFSMETDQQKRKELYIQFDDAFSGIIKDWRSKTKEKLESDEMRDEFQKLSDRENKDLRKDILIAALSENDMMQVSHLGQNELGLLPWIVNEEHSCTPFVESGYSFVAKKGDEVLGFILAYKCPTFGGYYALYIDTFVVSSAAQGKGIGKMLFDQVKEVAEKQRIYAIKLATKRSIPAHEIYKHWGFRDEDEEYVHMTIY